MEKGKGFEAEEPREARHSPEASMMTRTAVPQETTDQTNTSLVKDLPCDSYGMRPTKHRLSHGEGVSSEPRRSARLAKIART
jgi:hypothetical protein